MTTGSIIPSSLSVVSGVAFLLMLALAFVYPALSPAALGQSSAIVEPLVLDASPRMPQPGDTVSVSVKSFVTDIDRSFLTWTVNGVVVKQGVGEALLEVEAGPAGSRLVVRISAQTADLGLLSKDIVLSPANVDLIWEADTYTPPFYAGKALAASKSSVRVIAIPELVTTLGEMLEAEDLIYTWSEGGRVLGSLSGRGKQSVTLEGAPLFNRLDVSVTVESPDRSLAAVRQIAIPASAAQVLIYENHPTLGIRTEIAVEDRFELTEEEVSFLAVPLFFSGSERDDIALTYRWRVDGETIDSVGDPSSITLRPMGGAGVASIDLSVSSARNLLQSATAQFTIQFGGSENPSLF